MKLLSVAVLGAVLVVVGCGSPDAGSAPSENESSSAAPTSTPPEVTDRDQQGDLLFGPWLLVSGSVDEQPIPTEPDLVMRFGESLLSFPLACNFGTVPYEVNGTSIELDIDHFALSLERCQTDQATLFETGLLRVETAMMSDDGQQVEFEGDAVSMQFSRGTGE